MLLILLELLLYFTGAKTDELRGVRYHSKLDILDKLLSSLTERTYIMAFKLKTLHFFFQSLTTSRFLMRDCIIFPMAKPTADITELSSEMSVHLVKSGRKKSKWKQENFLSITSMSGRGPYEWNFEFLSIIYESSLS